MPDIYYRKPSWATALIIALWSVSIPVFAAHDVRKSFVPTDHLGDFILKNLDIASFRSSLGPKRSTGDHGFKDIAMKPTAITNSSLIFDSDYWHFELNRFQVGDFNGDGIADIKACLLDRAKQGTYDVQEPLLLTRYAADGPLVAIDFPTDLRGCEKHIQ